VLLRAPQGAKSVEVRPVGISKGLAMSRIMGAIRQHGNGGPQLPGSCGGGGGAYDFVLVAGHFLARDENIFTFFEGQSIQARAVCLFWLPP
jgi:trehalose 6-phosphate synthase/phosphatase